MYLKTDLMLDFKINLVYYPKPFWLAVKNFEKERYVRKTENYQFDRNVPQ